MTETEYTKECLSIWFRLMLAMLALLAIIIGATVGRFITQSEAITPIPTAVLPGTMLDFTTFGAAGSIVFFMLFLRFCWLTRRCLLKLKRATEVSNA